MDHQIELPRRVVGGEIAIGILVFGPVEGLDRTCIEVSGLRVDLDDVKLEMSVLGVPRKKEMICSWFSTRMTSPLQPMKV